MVGGLTWPTCLRSLARIVNAHRLLPALALLFLWLARAQQASEPAVFAPEVDARTDAIRAELRPAKAEPPKQKMWVDFTAIDAPKSVDEFQRLWHQPPVCQGLSGMCWCFSTTSFLESESQRLSGRQLHFSVLHTVYWEYVEKAREFVRTRGKSAFGEGSQSAAVLRAWRTYGVVPAEAYTGLRNGATNYDHESTVFAEIKKYLEGLKASGAWAEEPALAQVRGLLDFHLGAPPATVSVEGRALTPRQYLTEVARLNPDDYVALVSFLDQPRWQFIEYPVPDNWWHGREYWNVPLAEFTTAFKSAIGKGFSVVVAADISEPGYSMGPPGVAVVPAWDIPSAAIDERARQFRFSNGTTADDHALHVIGHAERQGKTWYLLKDSWGSAWNNAHPGYYFCHEDYVKLKVLAFMVHKDAVADLLSRTK